ncbi:MAG TPA: response regulator transcription factor [Cyclobacteriaceae bacterium]|nr:response regulator transcription factor [Cyclobacteriaceae bacterium]HRF34396.1 response regulator transcription factor [Cyclobacteriaceae bacterium]
MSESKPQAGPESIMIVDDHPATRKGLSIAIQSVWPTCETIVASTGYEAVDFIQKGAVNLILLDYQLPGINGLEVTEHILRWRKKTPILLYTFLDSLLVASHFLRLGGKGFVTKGADFDVLIKAIETLMRGDYYFHSGYETEIVRYLMNGLREQLPKVRFTERELEISIKLSKGLTAREVAQELGLSARTVETHKQNLMEKTKTKNAIELVGFMYQHGVKML